MSYFYTPDGVMRAVLANRHRQFEDILLDIHGFLRVLVCHGRNREVINFYAEFYPITIWRVLTPRVPLFRHRLYINRRLHARGGLPAVSSLRHAQPLTRCECAAKPEPASPEPQRPTLR